MKNRNKRIIAGLSVALLLYFGAYFACACRSDWVRKGLAAHNVFYRPFGGAFINALFTPARLIDDMYLRRTYWRETNAHAK